MVFSGAMAEMPEIKTKLGKGSEKVTKGLETAKCLSQTQTHWTFLEVHILSTDELNQK